jgi:bacteriorhodopsin
MQTLSIGEFSLVYNMLSFALAAMLGSFIFFVLAREQVDKKYRPALVMSAIVVAVAGYHYWRIFESWGAAFTLENGSYVPSGTPFNDGYRYVDWLLTVPLLVAELIAVLALARAKSINLTAKLVVAAVLMIGLGYPGEIATDMTARAVWGALSTIPFVYILWVLWVELGRAVERESSQVKILLRNTRLLLLATWGFYPIVYMLPMFGIVGATALVGVQVGYSIADVAAKCGYGLMIYAIARAKSEADQAAQGVLVKNGAARSEVKAGEVKAGGVKAGEPAARQG